MTICNWLIYVDCCELNCSTKLMSLFSVTWVTWLDLAEPGPMGQVRFRHMVPEHPFAFFLWIGEHFSGEKDSVTEWEKRLFTANRHYLHWVKFTVPILTVLIMTKPRGVWKVSQTSLSYRHMPHAKKCHMPVMWCCSSHQDNLINCTPPCLGLEPRIH